MSAVNVIFLDCDGVLNDMNTKHRIKGVVGFDRRKIQKLKEIIDATDAKIVLSSTWKADWKRPEDKSGQTVYGDYLEEQLARERISIFDKTEDEGENRGEGILRWLDAYSRKNPCALIRFIVIDDELYDFKETGLVDKLLKTQFYSSTKGGLMRNHIPVAIEMLEHQVPYSRNIKLRTCPFCGGEAHIVVCDDEGNLHPEDGYETDPWSGLGYMITHEASDVPEGRICPIATHMYETLGMHIYDSREEIAEVWGEVDE